MIRTLTLAAVLASSVPSAAWADTMKMPMHHGAAAATPEAKANAEAMQKMMKAMDVKPTGLPDKDFVLMMLPHHQGAVDMAKIEIQYGKDPAMIELARSIVVAQETEIATMKAWLAAH